MLNRHKELKCMLTDYSVLISESYDYQHKLLTEELKRKGTKVHICGDTEIELEIGAVKYTPDVIVIDCCKLGYKSFCIFVRYFTKMTFIP